MHKNMKPFYEAEGTGGAGGITGEIPAEGKTEIKEENKKDVEDEKTFKKAFEAEKKKLSEENERLKNEIDRIKRAHLSEEEIKREEMEELERTLEERESAVKASENRLYAVKAIKAAGLDDGGDKSLALIDFVMADDTKIIDERIKSFGALVDRYVKDGVEKTFKSFGRSPRGVGDGEPSEKVNPALKFGKTNAETKKTSEEIIKRYIGNY